MHDYRMEEVAEARNKKMQTAPVMPFQTHEAREDPYVGTIEGFASVPGPRSASLELTIISPNDRDWERLDKPRGHDEDPGVGPTNRR